MYPSGMMPGLGIPRRTEQRKKVPGGEQSIRCARSDGDRPEPLSGACVRDRKEQGKDELG